MSKQRFSIASLLLLIALVAAIVVIVLDRRKLAEVGKQLDQRNSELGFIDASVLKPGEGAIQHVPAEGTDLWKYRIYLPVDHEYQIEYLLGDADQPQHCEVEPFRPSGQFSLVIHKSIDILKPNFQQQEFFTTSVVDENGKPKHRYGIPWKAEDSALFRDDLGHYANVAGPNHKKLELFQIVNPVTLFRASCPSRTPEGKMLYIRLVPKSQLEQQEKPASAQ